MTTPEVGNCQVNTVSVQIGLILGITEKQAVRQLLPPRPNMVELMTDLYPDASIPALSFSSTKLSDQVAN